MVESTPGTPYGGGMEDLLNVESNMRHRRSTIQKYIQPDESPMTLSMFPSLGVTDRVCERNFNRTAAKKSQLDGLMSDRERYHALHDNVCAHRQQKLDIKVPIFCDQNTPSQTHDIKHINGSRGHQQSSLSYISLDNMLYGVGGCGLQVTFQAKNIVEARMLHDQLCPIGPVMLALTAATPIYKGYLADTDVRWNQAAAASDDRPEEERGTADQNGHCTSPRWSLASSFIAEDPRLRPEYQKTPLEVDEDSKSKLEDAGMDPLLSTHFAHVLAASPLLLTESDLRTSSQTDTNHFDSFSSSVWPHIRFKPPPTGSDIGWRVEFRPMEIQITDFENAAFSIFVTLLRRAITHYNLNFYIPLDRIEVNMERAHHRDAVREEVFFFRKEVYPTGTAGHERLHQIPVDQEYREMTINEIMNGTMPTGQFQNDASHFPGLIPIVKRYIKESNTDVSVESQISEYLDVLEGRASGRLWTAARWMRSFVRTHESYGRDSTVGEVICYDMILAMSEMAKCRRNLGPMFSSN
ncbi:hypothetical protein BP5796_05675 [Coleophoma crateriformis]|uniref:Glutamate--cysteine ligase n=1 Tax=Coleophoma crateriformis TaxID=565419 RepID=A0A3D8S3U0_9HELO|nr:hypothetical protein BP5796_05675 [Coleophoma crateriformis]